MTPNTAELYSAHIPALATLMALGWEYMPPHVCLAQRGGNGGLVLRPELVARLATRRFSYKGASHPLSPNAIDQIVRELATPLMHEGLIAANEKLYNALTLGITVSEFVEGKKVSVTVSIIDWQEPSKNSFTVSEEVEVLNTAGTGTRRPDIICYVNGLPLVVIEAKRPGGGNPNSSMVSEGISQTIRNQKPDEIPHLFAFAQLLLSISMTDGRYGTTKTPAKFWTGWRDEEFDEAHFLSVKNAGLRPDRKAGLLATREPWIKEHFTQLWSAPQAVTGQDRLLVSLLTPERFLEFIRYFILFDRKVGKIAARHQQAFGIKALLREVAGFKPDGGRKGGVLWHTTGSGKSFTMVFLCKALLMRDELKSCRVVVVTDRTDLEKQLAKNFISSGAFGSEIGTKKEGEKAKASSGRDLAKRIGKGQERIIFTIINKFASASKLPECRNTSADLIVLVDEGHRSQGGENHERMRKALPNASYIAFTGTPLLKDDKTSNKFGRIVHAYTMRDATSDGTVTPLLYEERRPVLDINEEAIDNWFEKITRGLSDKQKSDLKEKYGKKGRIYGSLNRIDLIALDIAVHFSENFKALDIGLKGQLATDSKLSAIRYKKALDATGLVISAVVISPPDTREGHADVDESELPEVQQWWKDNVRIDPKLFEEQVIDSFSTEGSPDILIVVDKLLTGFDEPRNTVLYIDKRLEKHNLIQAIARVNRLHDQKKFGFLIDYRGILEELDTAISAYQDLAERTQGGFDMDDIEGLFANVSTEYKRLPKLHDTLWSLFGAIENRRDTEQFRQLLVPRFRDDGTGHQLDDNQKFREDFYAALTDFGICLRNALSTRSFFEDTSFGEKLIATYKRDLQFFTELRRIARTDAQETVDFSAYDEQIRKLVDRYVVGEKIVESGKVVEVTNLGLREDPADWSEEKTRNETDIIKSRLTKTIEQELADDPYAQAYFSDLLRQAIEEAGSYFDHPIRQYALFKDVEQKVRDREVNGTPKELSENRHSSAYFGILRMAAGDDRTLNSERESFIGAAKMIEEEVMRAVAENSVNPQNIESAIRKSLLPKLFALLGLEQAKDVVDQIVSVTRIGLSQSQKRA
jgi:type I restriction enzyme, R subunit